MDEMARGIVSGRELSVGGLSWFSLINILRGGIVVSFTNGTCIFSSIFD